MRNVLSLVQSFAARVGIPQPSFAVLNTDPQVRQIMGLLEECLEEIRFRGRWTSLIREATFTSVLGEDQGLISDIAPFGFDQIISDTIFDRTRRWEIYGPLSGREWQIQKAFPTQSVPYLRYRIRDGRLLFPLNTPAGLQCAFEYTSRYCVLDADGVTWNEFINSDNDSLAFPDIVVLAALRWKWKYEKGLEYAEDFRRYEEVVTQALSAEGRKPMVILDDKPSGVQPAILIPTGNWNIP